MVLILIRDLNNFRIASFNLELLCFSISLDIPSKPQDFLFFRDFILPISSLNAMGLSKWFSSSFVVNSRSCNLEVRCFWVRVGSFCE